MATYRQILNEVTRKSGDVWKTSAGTWAGKRGDKTQYGLTDKDKAHNIKVHKAKVRAAKFYAPETVEKVDGVYTYRDGDYHKHTDTN